VIEVPIGGATTLTGATPVTATPGSTLVIPAGTPISGTSITLTSPAPGVTTIPVTIRIGTHTLTVTPGDVNTVATVNNVMVNGVSTPVLEVSSGTLTVSAAPSEPLLIMANNGGVITAGNSGGAVTQSMNGDSTTTLSVTDGYVVLPANAFAAVAITDDKLYAGEIAQISADGTVTQVRFGSLNGADGALGDPISLPVEPNLFALVNPPRLDGSATRLGNDLSTAIISEAGHALNMSITGSVQNTWGILTLALPGAVQSYALPVGEIIVDTGRADGLTVTARNQIQVAKNGIITTFSPMVADPGELLRAAQALSPLLSLQILEDGLMHIRIGNATYVMQPGWTTEQSGDPAGISNNERGEIVYTDAHGQQQILYPVFDDLVYLTNVVEALDSNATLAANNNGSLTMELQGATYTLTPDYVLSTVPAQHLTDAWWIDGDKMFIRNSGGTAAQGFSVSYR